MNEGLTGAFHRSQNIAAVSSCKKDFFFHTHTPNFSLHFPGVSFFQIILRESRKLMLKSIPPLFSLACKHVYKLKNTL